MKNAKATSYKDLIAQLQSVSHPEKSKPARKPLQLKKQFHNISQKQPQSHQQSVSNWERNVTSYSNEKFSGANDSTSRDSPFLKDKKQITHAYNKFITQITCILVDIIKIKPPELLVQKISYIEYLEVLKQLKLIHENYEPRQNDLVGDMWSEVVSHQNIIGNFILVIASILRVNRYDDTQCENSQYLFKKYANLRYTRMELKGKKMKTEMEPEYSFRPMVSDRSRHLATSHSKSRGKSNSKKHCYKENIEKNNSILTNKKENSSLNSNISHQSSLLGVKRSEILYTLARQKSLEKKIDKTSNEIEFQRSANDLTFMPKIHQNIEKKLKKKCINGEQNTISRMIRGRVQREIKKIINSKGLPYNQKLVDKMRKEKYEAIMKQKKLFSCQQNKGFIDLMAHSNHESIYINPIDQGVEAVPAPQPPKNIDLPLSDSKPKRNKIILDIYVDQDRCQKLIIEQNESLQAAAAGFVKKNSNFKLIIDLSQQMYQKLLRELQKAMKFQLTQIDENSFQEDIEQFDPQ